MENTLNILVVEDEVVTSIYIKTKLEKMGYHVVKTLTRGEDAIEAVEKLETHLVLMDINLAGVIDGIEAVKKIREKSDLPVIFITGYSDEKLVKKAMNLCPAGFLTKPLDYNELNRIITNSFQIQLQ